MVTTRSQEKRTQETPKQSASQDGLSVSTRTPADSANSPKFFTPATSKPARVSTEHKALLAEAGQEAAPDQGSKEASQPAERDTTHGPRVTVVIPKQSHPETTVEGKTPSKSAPATDDIPPSGFDAERTPVITAELPERPRAAELYFTPMTTNKRKRFGSDDGPDDSTLGLGTLQEETPSQPSGPVPEVPEVPETDDDDDDGAPEVVSSKTAARQVRKASNPFSRASRRKRSKPTINSDDVGAASTPEQRLAEKAKDEQGPTPQPTQTGISDEFEITVPALAPEPVLPPSEESLPDPSAVEAQPDTINPLDTAQVSTLEPKPVGPVEETLPALSEVATDSPSKNDKQGKQDISSDYAAQTQSGSHSANSSADTSAASPEQNGVSRHNHEDTTRNEARTMEDATISRPVTDMIPFKWEDGLSRPRTTNSSAISRPNPRSKRPLPRLPEVQSKPSSLEQYRAKILNRHPRTTKWNRKARFVGV